MSIRRRNFAAAAALALLAACTSNPTAPSGSDAIVAAPRFGSWGFDISGMDTTARPGDDFVRYASGAWYQRTQIPPDLPRYGSFIALRDLSEQRVARLVESYKPGDPAATPDQAKLAKLYRSFMDEGRAQAEDAGPLAIRLEA